MSTPIPRQQITERMQKAGMRPGAIDAFLAAVQKAAAGDTGLWPESEIEPVISVPSLDSVGGSSDVSLAVLKQLAVIKLNGGLGTSMGLERAKSLLVVKDNDTFLDFIVRQILLLRSKTGERAPDFYLMNSPLTREDTLNYLKNYPELAGGGSIDFVQSAVPKVHPDTFEPVRWPEDPELEWCPPGHGDIYPSVLDTGLLQQMLDRGIRYLFVSNSDNLGATVDPALLAYFAQSGLSFLMEVAERTTSDRKGGHLARRRSDGRLLLRESVQCPKNDEAAFQDIQRHRFFNTNNLWIRLEDLRAALDQNNGVIPLPLIKNSKTVDPRRADSPKVLQLESAMGAAIQTFPRAGALLVPRNRFTPVKTTSDLLVLRSDACLVTEDARLVLAPRRKGQPPLVDLDPAFKLMSDFDVRFPFGPPSLLDCDSLRVTGDFSFASRVVCHGKVEFSTSAPGRQTIPPGTYANNRFVFP